jgi:ribose 5-phosphate isomerase A
VIAMDMDALKRQAAEQAAALVTDGMRLGLGTGSTAKHFVDCIGERVAAGLKVTCVPTSEQTRRQAAGLGIPLATLDEVAVLDLTVDGADEIDPALNLLKGGGGAHLREKMVAAASGRLVIIADETKVVATLGRFPLPIEVVCFGVEATRRGIVAAAARAGCSGELKLRHRPDGQVFVTDEGHMILDGHFGRIPDAPELARQLSGVAGVVEHGLFIGMASLAFIAGAGGVRRMGQA